MNTQKEPAMHWQPIETAPNDGRELLVTFKGQFNWVIYVAIASYDGVRRDGYAPPTHWMPLPEPPNA